MLREITLGLDNLDVESGNHELFSEEYETEGEYSDTYNNVQQCRQYACLSLSLEDGLDLLKDMKQLRRLRLDGMGDGLGDQERDWVKKNWPDYRKESRDSFWTNRGHRMSKGTCGGVGPPQHQELFIPEEDWRDETNEFDWW